LKEAKETFDVVAIKPTSRIRRDAVAVQLPVAVADFVQFKPDPNDLETLVAGAQCRVGCAVPKTTSAFREELAQYTLEFCKKNFRPLSPDSDTSIETWLASCPYPAWRKAQLLDLWYGLNQQFGNIKKKHCKVKAFCKDEFYPEIKHARGIYSRTDVFKCHVGPIFRLMEKEIFKHKAFIKKIAVADRPNYVRENLERVGYKYGCADYTAFESHFRKEIMGSLEFVVYDYMLQYLPEGAKFMDIVRSCIGGQNVCEFKSFTVLLNASRMSGEMNTSLGNGLSNLILLSYLFHKLGIDDVPVVVEGDDSLFAFLNLCPSKEDFERCGFTIKLETTDSVAAASFCGMIFDTETNINICDPRDALVTFGWAGKFYTRTNKKNLMKLLRCKALSYAHQYPGCPIVAALAKCALRATRSYDVRSFVENTRGIDMWDREKYRHALSPVPDVEVTMGTRLLMEKTFAVPVQSQIEIENYLLTTDNFGALAGPIAELIDQSPNSKLWRHQFNQYSEVCRYAEEVEACQFHWPEKVQLRGKWAVSHPLLRG